MKTIGLLGGTGWSSTIEYYRIINEMIHARLGGQHSAKILLKSIDYHDIVTRYGQPPEQITPLLKNELLGLLALNPDCFIICCNTLHKYFDLFKNELDFTIPFFHAVELTAKYLVEQKFKNVLLLATKFTMEDGFFANTLAKQGMVVTIPDQQERNEMQVLHGQVMKNQITDQARKYFQNLTLKYQNLDGVILGCSEWTLMVNSNNSALPIIDPMYLQCLSAVDYSLARV